MKPITAALVVFTIALHFTPALSRFLEASAVRTFGLCHGSSFHTCPLNIFGGECRPQRRSAATSLVEAGVVVGPSCFPRHNSFIHLTFDHTNHNLMIDHLGVLVIRNKALDFTTDKGDKLIPLHQGIKAWYYLLTTIYRNHNFKTPGPLESI